MQLADAARRYRNALLAEGRSRHTIEHAKSALKGLCAVMDGINVTQVAELDHDVLMVYCEELAWHVTAKGTPFAPRSQAESLRHVRGFCRYLVREEWLMADPSARLPNPKKPQPLPRAILEAKEVQAMMAQPDMRSARGQRDRAILEVLYSTALRRTEIANLTLQDVDTAGGYVHVRQGKGRKDRVVPLGQNVCALLDTYVAGVRGDWVNAAASEYLFLNRWGTRMSPHSVWEMVHLCAQRAGIKKPVSTHTFRHSCATHMLRNGAPIRHLQEMLGHVSLETTQVYTRVTINELKAAHGKYHPREKSGKDEA